MKKVTIKDLKRNIILISIAVLVFALLNFYIYINVTNAIIAGKITVEHEVLINKLGIISRCVSILSILALNITVVLTEKKSKKFYYKLVGVFSIFIL